MTARYEIRVEGQVDQDSAAAFETLALEHRRDETVLHGEIADQAALHGLLDRIQELGLHLLEVRRIPNGAGEKVPAESPPA